MKKLTVIGLGYVGLPLAVQAAAKGWRVTGVDLNEKLVSKINNRVSPFVNDARFNEAFAKVKLSSLLATTASSPLAQADVAVICVPTPTEDNVPDLTYVIQAAKSVAGHLHPGQLVILESTVNPGVTRDTILPLLQKPGLVCGKDFYLAHCPERIDPGNEKFYVGNLNRVVGGITPECTKRAVAFYRGIIDAEIVELTSPEEAEFVKSWENSQRNVMIALANEAAIICDALNMDVDNIMKGLQSKVDQLGLSLARPGIGPGGHCIPEDIHYVIKKARQNGLDTRFLDAAADLNDRMPRYAVGQLQRMARRNGEDLSDLRIALLGIAYKEDIADPRRSPAIEVARLLAHRAASVIAHDPFIAGDSLHVRGLEWASDLQTALKGADAVFVATAHRSYQTLTASFLKERGIRYVLDGRNFLDQREIERRGIAYKGIGR